MLDANEKKVGKNINPTWKYFIFKEAPPKKTKPMLGHLLPKLITR